MAYGNVNAPGMTPSEVAGEIAEALKGYLPASQKGAAGGVAALNAAGKLAQMPTAADVGAVPTSRKVNNKALGGDIALTAADVGTMTAAAIQAALASKVEMGARTQIPANADLNNTAYVLAKGFAVAANVTAATIKNCPVKSAFILDTFSSVGGAVNPKGAWCYIFQRLINVAGEIWVRRAETNGNAVWSFGVWQKVALGNYLPLAGGTLTGRLTAQNNTAYTTKQVRNVTLSTAAASGGGNGDLFFTYV